MAHFLIYIMGVSGSGKSTIGKALSREWGIPFFDGDDFHPPENVAKMASGQSLDDDDRAGWLSAISSFAKKKLDQGSLLVACSALKNSYRKQLASGIADQVRWIFLDGSKELILSRLENRSDHFMPSSLLNSQFKALEIPAEAIHISIDQSVDQIIFSIKQQLSMGKSSFGVVGLGVMGKSLSRNLASKGFQLSLYNRHLAGSEEGVALQFIQDFPELAGAKGFEQLGSFVESLESPRKILLMLPAGEATDSALQQLVPLLSPGDVLIDGGNAHYKDTERRFAELGEKGIHFLGCGISGGEEGALKGPSIMPGGSQEAYALVRPFLEAIAAKDKNGDPCCSFIGTGGAGHFVKMVHNGIEYGEMQLLAEAITLLKEPFQVNPDEVAREMETTWLNTDARSYLLEITIDILRKKEGEAWLVDKILDKAGNKGTGGWTNIAASELGVPIPTIAAALFARYQSAQKEDRVRLAKHRKIKGHQGWKISSSAVYEITQLARYANHVQGFQLIEEASNQYGWAINLSELARIWTNGCIIRSVMMEQFVTVLESSEHPLVHPVADKILEQATRYMPGLLGRGMWTYPLPCLAASAYYLVMAFQEHSSANIIQAQRDYFGAHTYQRIDDPEGRSYHTDWKKTED